MKKSILYLLLLCGLFFSCTKTVPIPLSYSVTDLEGNAIQNVYIADTGSTTFPVLVKFLQGNTDDSVKLILSGLPANVTTTPDTFSAKPTYTENFVLTSHSATDGTYQVSIIAYTPTTGYKTYTFNLVVIPANCATLFNGTLTGSNACSVSTGYSGYTSAAVANASGTLTINNFGGYGSNTNATVVLNCDKDSLYVYSQNIGNGVTVQGAGTFTSNSLVITYTATNIPTGGNAACTVTYTK